MSRYGELVGRHGLATSHALLLAEVPPASRVLDVGCAEGYLARPLRERGCTLTGLEADPASAAAARPLYDALVEGDVEDPAVRERVDGTYDRILFGDVLEHLRDPSAVLAWGRGRLAPGGLAVVSLPNIAHWTARRQIARGRFPHHDDGLFDRTHLRFFTRASARALVEQAGLTVVREAFAGAPLPLQSHVGALARLEPLLVRRRPELFALQVVLTCAPGVTSPSTSARASR